LLRHVTDFEKAAHVNCTCFGKRILLGALLARPIDGRAGTRLIDLGNIVRASSSTAIVIINQIQPISVEFNVALDRNDRELAMGRMTVVDKQVSVTTGTVRYKATFENADV
jgi:membrane fusion protein, multidrug efflux system